MNFTRSRGVLLAMLGLALLQACASGSPAETVSSTPAASAAADSVDRAFITGMVPHHQRAIKMAKVELEKGSDPRVRTLAQSIIDNQEREIDEMTKIAVERLGFRPEREMSGSMGTIMGMRISTDMSKMGDELRSRPNIDRSFLEMMIPHHASAVVMANEEVRNGRDSDLKSMARSIIDAQAKEIGEMQDLLKQLGT